MKRILCVLTALVFLTGCALTTIRPPKKRVAKKKPVTVLKEIFKPKPKPAPKPVAVKEKEETLPEEEIK